MILFFSVSGFDHAPLDNRQQNWYQFLYPYRLGNYNKKPLAPPVCLTSLDFRQQCQSKVDFAVSIPLQSAGRCDGVALWVDYILDNEGTQRLTYWNGIDFPPYLTQSVKLFRTPQNVQVGQTLDISATLELGQSDFEYSFNLRESNSA